MKSKRVLTPTNKTWSNFSDWPTQKVPDGTGEEVIIEESDEMTLDQTTQVTNHLKISGTLIFKENVDGLTLNAKIIEIMPTGKLIIGKDYNNRYSGSAKIVLHGDPNDPEVSVGPQLGRASKCIINRGEIQIYGPKKNEGLYLYDSAKKDSSHLRVGTSWLSPGDRLVVPSSSSKTEEYDVVTVNTVHGDCVTTKEKLSFFHHESSSTAQPSKPVRLLNLTRSFVIEGTGKPDFGCVIVNPVYEDPNDSSNWIQGSLTLVDVEIKKCGQHSLGLAAVNAISPALSSTNTTYFYLKNCSIHSSSGNAINIKNIGSASVSHTSIFDSVEKAINVENSRNVGIQNNSILNVHSLKPESNGVRVNFGVYVAGHLPLDQTNISIKDNTVSSIGGFGVGYFTPGYSCTEDHQIESNYKFYSNQAHSCDIGWLGTNTLTHTSSCAAFGGLIGFKNRHSAFLYLGENLDVVIRRMHLFDNRAGISVNVGVQQGVYPSVAVQDIDIYGRGFPDMPDLYKNEAECRTDGVIVPFFSIGKVDYDFADSNLPTLKPVSVDSVPGGLFFEKVNFLNFGFKCGEGEADSVLSHSVVVKNACTSVPPSVYFVKTSIDFSQREAVLFDEENLHCDPLSFCALNKCAGFTEVLFYDYGTEFNFERKIKDTLFYSEGKTIHDPDCEPEPGFKLAKCEASLGHLFIEQLTTPSESRVFPVRVKVKDLLTQEVIMSHTVNGDTRSAAIFKAEHLHELEFSEPLHSDVQIFIQTSNRDGWAEFRIKLDPSLAVSVYKGARRLEYEQENTQTGSTNFCGKSKFNPTTNELTLFLDASDDCKLRLRFVKALETGLKINESMDDFIQSKGQDKITAFVESSVGVPGHYPG